MNSYIKNVNIFILMLVILYLMSLMSSIGYLCYNRKKINARYYGDILTIDKNSKLFRYVANYCDNLISTSECDTWDIYENNILFCNNNDKQSYILLSILANLFKPENIHVVDTNPYNLYDYDYDNYSFTYHPFDEPIELKRNVDNLDNSQVLNSFYSRICEENNIGIIIDSTTNETKGKTNIYKPFMNISISCINDFIELYKIPYKWV